MGPVSNADIEGIGAGGVLTFGRIGADGSTQADSARVYDTSTVGQVGNRQWGCDLQNLAAIEEFGDGVLVLGDDLICFSQTVAYP